MEVPVPRRSTFWNSLSFKIIVIGILVLIMLIPTSMILSLIRERESTRQEVTGEVGAKWGLEQTLAGPVLTVPYNVWYEDGDKTFKQLEYAHFLPEDLKVESRLQSEIRHRGIYKTVVYSSVMNISGHFTSPDPARLKLDPENFLPGDAFLQVGISDMRGIQERLEISWNGRKIDVEPGIPVRQISTSGFHSRVPLDGEDRYDFSFELVLNGSDYLNFTPLGKVSRVKVSSDWPHPKFDGAFLPDERDVSEQGFTASWKVLHLNRNYPQAWTGNSYETGESGFGVSLLLPVDRYLKTERSAKYAIMFIVLTFMIFFLVEVLNRKRIHPVQYLLVGLSISIFYILLLSLSEHIGFHWAYLAAAAAVISLITAYSGSIFRDRKLTLTMGTALTVLYLFLYVLIQLKDYALLMGSIGLFIAMAIVMYASRNIDWYTTGKEKPGGRQIGY